MENNALLADGPLQQLFEVLAGDLETKCYSVVPAAMMPRELDALSAHLAELSDRDFQPAGVGRGGEVGRNRFVRSNSIHWHDPSQARTRIWFSWIGQLQTYLNQRLFLGLTSFESHFTRYSKGDFYRRHLDAFKGERNRVVSLVTYMNPGWQPDQGGELVLYPEDAPAVRVTPERGTLALFLSEEVPHEVLPTDRVRYGVAGWFRVDDPII